MLQNRCWSWILICSFFSHFPFGFFFSSLFSFLKEKIFTFTFIFVLNIRPLCEACQKEMPWIRHPLSDAAPGRTKCREPVPIRRQASEWDECRMGNSLQDCQCLKDWVFVIFFPTDRKRQEYISSPSGRNIFLCGPLSRWCWSAALHLVILRESVV